MSTPERFLPLIYVRGYAMTTGEQDETTADPFCGFNIGSTVYRAVPETTVADRQPKKFVFESPVVRLMRDHGYALALDEGKDIRDPTWAGALPARPLVIYNYYEQASALLGEGKTPAITTFARELNELVLRLRNLFCQQTGLSPKLFRCYLAAHSMGGLICRAFLQNHTLSHAAARNCIDKFFTYATPHNGIEIAGFNVPAWLSLNDMNNFNRKKMAEYLNLEAIYEKTGRVDWIPEEAFPSQKVFCLIGTNRSDYTVAGGASKTFAGNGSDGLVKIENASTWGANPNGTVSSPCATAYLHRSHSGFFGIVNSEESYQNLTRFLFGDLRIDIWLDIGEVRVPDELKDEDKAGKVDALYQFEILLAPRGKRWALTRRRAEEDSPACRSHLDLRKKPEKRSVYLSTAFLAKKQKVDPNDPSMTYQLKLGIRTPDYVVDRAFWWDRHFEGSYLFQDGVTIAIVPPAEAGGLWEVRYDWQRDTVDTAGIPIEPTALAKGRIAVEIPLPVPVQGPAVGGKLRFVISLWNQ